jgi:hypothetical protein
MKSFLRTANASRPIISSGSMIFQLRTCSCSFEQYTFVRIKIINLNKSLVMLSFEKIEKCSHFLFCSCSTRIALLSLSSTPDADADRHSPTTDEINSCLLLLYSHFLVLRVLETEAATGHSMSLAAAQTGEA